jgi:hypothetical protein
MRSDDRRNMDFISLEEAAGRYNMGYRSHAQGRSPRYESHFS